MNPTNIIFDLDGTLLDTLADIAAASNLALNDLGFPPHPVDAYRTLVGDGVVVLFERALPPRVATDGECISQGVAAFKRHYDRLWHQTSRPYPGIQSMLERLSGGSVGLSVLSNKPHEFTRACVRHFFPTIRWSQVLGDRPGVARKPDPAGVRAILDATSGSADRCLYVGDTNTDMQTAVGAGCVAVGVTWGFRTAEELTANGAEYLIDAPGQLFDLLGRCGSTRSEP